MDRLLPAFVVAALVLGPAPSNAQDSCAIVCKPFGKAVDGYYARMTAGSGADQRASVEPRPGGVLRGKLPHIPVHARADKGAAQLGTLGSGESAVYVGEECGRYYRVAVAQGEGWGDTLLVGRPGS